METPFDQVNPFLTPTKLFYIRTVIPGPELDLLLPAEHRWCRSGITLFLSYKNCEDMPSETRVATYVSSAQDQWVASLLEQG